MNNTIYRLLIYYRYSILSSIKQFINLKYNYSLVLIPLENNCLLSHYVQKLLC